MLLAPPPVEPITEHILDQIPLGKAQRLDRRAYESPALPLSYSAAVSSLSKVIQSGNRRPSLSACRLVVERANKELPATVEPTDVV